MATALTPRRLLRRSGCRKIVMLKLLALTLVFSLLSPNVRTQSSFSPKQFTADFDYLWSALRESYVYLDKKETDWNRVRELYRPMRGAVKTRSDFVALLERVLDELYDNHLSLNTNLKTSPRLVPTGLDVWAEWRNQRAVITQLRRGFSAEQAGLKVGMEIISVNGVPVESAVARRLPKTLKVKSSEARNWALRAVLAGTHDQPRIVVAKFRNAPPATYRLDLDRHVTVDNHSYKPKVEWKILPQRIGYIKINDLISSDIVSQFDAALAQLRTTHGLMLDIRDIPRGGNTDVAEPILGRLISRRIGYQEVVPLHQAKYIKEVSPRGDWVYEKPIVVLVNRWTASMGEGIAIGLDGMKRATIVGTRMAGLNGGVFNLELPNTKIGVIYPGERLNHINGTPRENIVPPVLVDLMGRDSTRSSDPIFTAGFKIMLRLIQARRN